MLLNSWHQFLMVTDKIWGNVKLQSAAVWAFKLPVCVKLAIVTCKWSVSITV